MSLLGVELENNGVLVRFVETSVESAGARHVQEARYSPRSPKPPYHRHPKQDERFTVIDGALTFYVDGVERVVRAGDAIDIPRRSLHWVRNSADAPALATWETRPALRTAELFVAMNRAMQGRPRPRLVDAIAILAEYRDEIELANPPALVQRVLFACLAPFGRRALDVHTRSSGPS